MLTNRYEGVLENWKVRLICRGLSLGSSFNELANSLGISWHAARARVEAIRRHFEQLRLAESVLSDGGRARR